MAEAALIADLIVLRLSHLGFFPIFSSPSKWEKNPNNDKNHGTNDSSVKLLVDFVWIGCCRPNDDPNRGEQHNGPSLFPPDE